MKEPTLLASAERPPDEQLGCEVHTPSRDPTAPRTSICARRALYPHGPLRTPRDVVEMLHKAVLHTLPRSEALTGGGGPSRLVPVAREGHERRARQ